jgi:acyl-lipid omega-6 desaturase (Delta-12 desaturase)
MNMKNVMVDHLKKYKAQNIKAISFLLSYLFFGVTGAICSFEWNWYVGQILLAIFFFQSFILLHEVGHYSFFKGKTLNTIFGHLFGFLSFIPFISWVDIHNQHHKWTGWRDKDPTTSGTINPEHGLIVKSIINVCWFCFIPLFTLGYRIGNYWNLGKIKKFSPKTNRKKVTINLLIILITWAFISVLYSNIILDYILPAYVLGLVISDLIILSQHSHIDIPISNGEAVRPVKYSDQTQYTRSLKFGKWFEHWVLFNFNLHEKHHAFPGLPAYYLQKKECSEMNKRPFVNYFWNAKRMTGQEFVFSTTKYSDKTI